MRRLSDLQRKEIIAEFVECGNYSAVARKYNLSVNGVKKIVQKDAQSARKCKEKKEENTRAVLDFMESRKDKACGLIDLLMDDMADEKKRNRAGLQQTATAMGILIDKFVPAETMEKGKAELTVYERLAQERQERMRRDGSDG